MHKHRSQGPDIRSFCQLIAEFQPFCRLEHLPILGHTIMFGRELQIGQFPRAPPLKNPAHAPVVIYLSRAQVMYLHVSTSQRARVMYLHVSTSQSAHVMNLPVSTSQRAQVMYLPVSTSQRAPVMYNVQACAGYVRRPRVRRSCIYLSQRPRVRRSCPRTRSQSGYRSETGSRTGN